MGGYQEGGKAILYGLNNMDYASNFLIRLEEGGGGGDTHDQKKKLLKATFLPPGGVFI